MKTNSVKAFSDAMLSGVKKIDSEKVAKKLASSFSGIEEKIGKDDLKKISDALDALSAQGKAFIDKLHK